MTDQLRDRFFVADKDPEYMYRWCNERERVMLERIDQGFEVVSGGSELPPELRAVQSTENPTGGNIRKRGDVILMRCKRDVYEEKVLKPKREMRKRQEVSFDTAVEQANEQAQRLMRNAGLRGESVRKHMVFREDVEPGA
jgi:hypothetical protein